MRSKVLEGLKALDAASWRNKGFLGHVVNWASIGPKYVDNSFLVLHESADSSSNSWLAQPDI